MITSFFQVHSSPLILQGYIRHFLSERQSWSDNPLLNAEGFLFHDKGAGKYRIASLEKLSDLNLHGNMVTFDRYQCILTSEGNINFGVNYDLLKMSSSGTWFK